MELEEMRTAWVKMNNDLQQQKVLTDNIIINMTQQRYQNKFSGITTSEGLAAIICWGMAFYIIMNLNRLDTWYFLASGFFTISLLICLPVLSLKLLTRIKNVNIKDNTYKESIIQFSTRRKQFLLFQRITIYLNMILILVILPLASKLLNDEDIFGKFNLWGGYLLVLVMFMFFFSRWVYKAYKGVTNQAESILQEMENN